MSRLRVLLPVAASAASLIALVTPAFVGTASAADPSRYAAIGDSYTSSPFTGVPVGPNGFGCTRSDNNYPHVVQATLRASDFADISCGGARTDDVFASQTGPAGGTNAPQITAVTPETTIVTIGLGGNDIGFSEIVQNCVSTSPYGTPCRDRYTAGGTDQLAARIDATAPKIDHVLAEVKAHAAASARIYLVGYPAILPDTGDGCYPVVPYTPGDVAYLRDTEKRLNAMLRDRATAAGATYADTYTGSIGHDVCQLPGIKWIEGLVPTAPAAPVHPNALGSYGMGQLVLRTIQAGG